MRETFTQVYTLPSGAEIEVATIPERRAGASDVGFARDTKVVLEEVLAPLGEVAELLARTIRGKVREPDSLEVEFAVALKGQTKLLIVSGEAEGNIKVSLTWKRSEL